MLIIERDAQNSSVVAYRGAAKDTIDWLSQRLGFTYSLHASLALCRG